MLKTKHIFLIVLALLLIDQVSKIYVKTHFYLGEEWSVFGLRWFKIHFVENEGMAWGLNVGGKLGKVMLTLFRLVAVIAGSVIIKNLIAKKIKPILLLCAALMYAGALGNLMDSFFYGLIFSESIPFSHQVATLFPAGGGYGAFLQGKVVDMFYFPIITNAHFPQWVPFWGGQDFEFFRYVFNVADASLSVAMCLLFIFQKQFSKTPYTPVALDSQKVNLTTE